MPDAAEPRATLADVFLGRGGVAIDADRRAELDRLWQDPANWRRHWYGNTYDCATDGRLLVPHRPAGYLDKRLVTSVNTAHPQRYAVMAAFPLVAVVPGVLAVLLFGGGEKPSVLFLPALVLAVLAAVYLTRRLTRQLVSSEYGRSGESRKGSAP
jgi:hypothetical protein